MSAESWQEMERLLEVVNGADQEQKRRLADLLRPIIYASPPQSLAMINRMVKAGADVPDDWKEIVSGTVALPGAPLVEQPMYDPAHDISLPADGSCGPPHKRPEGPMSERDLAARAAALGMMQLERDLLKKTCGADELPRAKSRDQYWQGAE